ncbi:hypothetical protein ZEAMMB73_Zm00001d039540 [Zea mays]|uniref:Uncharacterized protein n=1 Tax=Zea mays TaxID=4577 RepID=A0A1D6MI95_MAIZE|nr:hypothetical protein ZEAMMB73_Zm00001d039540 [Zea mays]
MARLLPWRSSPRALRSALPSSLAAALPQLGSAQFGAHLPASQPSIFPGRPARIAPNFQRRGRPLCSSPSSQQAPRKFQAAPSAVQGAAMSVQKQQPGFPASRARSICAVPTRAVAVVFETAPCGVVDLRHACELASKILGEPLASIPLFLDLKCLIKMFEPLSDVNHS